MSQQPVGTYRPLDASVKQLIQYLTLHCTISKNTKQQDIPSAVVADWLQLNAKQKQQRLNESAQLVLVYARFEKVTLYQLTEFLEKYDSRHYSAVVRELEALPPIELARSLRRLRNVLGNQVQDEDHLTCPRYEAKEYLKWFHKSFTQQEQQVLLNIYGERVLRYASAERLEVKPLVDCLVQSKQATSELFDIIYFLEDRVEQHPDTQLRYAIEGMLANERLLKTCIRVASQPNALSIMDFGDEARRAYEAFRSLWQFAISLPELQNWYHLEAWRQVAEFATKLNHAAGSIFIWPDVWARLRRELIHDTDTSSDALQPGIKVNLLRLQEGICGISQPLPLPNNPALATASLNPQPLTIPGPDLTQIRPGASLPDAVISTTHVRINGKSLKMCARTTLVRMKMLELCLKQQSVTFSQLRAEIEPWKKRTRDSYIAQAVANACHKINKIFGDNQVLRRIVVNHTTVSMPCDELHELA